MTCTQSQKGVGLNCSSARNKWAGIGMQGNLQSSAHLNISYCRV